MREETSGKDMDADKAITEYKNALAIIPSYAPSQLNLGFAHLNKKDYNRAMEIFIGVSKEVPTYNPSLVHYGLGQVYQNKRMKEKAIKEYEIVLEIDPNNNLAKDRLLNIK